MNDETTEAKPQKWTSTAGPIQTNKVNKLLRDIRWESGTSTTLSGVIGVDEHKFTSTVLFGGKRPDVAAALLALGEEFDWTITRENYAKVIESGTAKLQELIDNTPVIDERRTVEQDNAQKEEHRKTREAVEAQQAAKAEAFNQAYGTGTDITLPDGQNSVVLTLCYNNSDSRSDYSDPHATIGRVLLAIVHGKQTERLARDCVARYPELAKLNFTWHTENYSGGHGNYLMGETFDLPAGVAEHYGKTHGHWEVQFNHFDRILRGYKGYPGVRPTFEASGPGATGSSGIEVRHNAEHNGVEIMFPGKPSPEVLHRVKKEFGFHWSPRSKVWYKRLDSRAWQQAHAIAGIDPAPPMPGTEEKGPDRFDMAVEDRMAEQCGL